MESFPYCRELLLSSIVSGVVFSVSTDIASCSRFAQSQIGLSSSSPGDSPSLLFCAVFWGLKPIIVQLLCTVVLCFSFCTFNLCSKISMRTSFWFWSVCDSGNTCSLNKPFLYQSRDWTRTGRSFVNHFSLPSKISSLHNCRGWIVCWPHAHACRLYTHIRAGLSYLR